MRPEDKLVITLSLAPLVATVAFIALKIAWSLYRDFMNERARQRDVWKRYYREAADLRITDPEASRELLEFLKQNKPI